MTKKIHITVLFFFLALQLLTGQQRKFVSSHSIKDGLRIRVNDGDYRIRFFNDKIVEVNFIPEGELYNPFSHAVVLKPQQKIMEFHENANLIEMATPGIGVRIKKNPFKMQVFYKGKLLLSENRGYFKTDSTAVLDFSISGDEVLYGGGERVLGMNRRGNRLALYNRAHYGYETRSELMNFSMPIVVSSKRYMLHFDNPETGFLDLDSQKKNILSYETIGGRKTYQVIAADSWEDLLAAYADLTGHQPMPPRWALGNFSSRFGYHSQREVLETAKKFRAYQIPLDAIVLDIYWFGPEIKGSMGNLEFYKDSFPEPKKMIKTLKKEGIKTVLVTEPFILTTSKKWDEVSRNNFLGKTKTGEPYAYDFYFGHTGLIDIYNPKAKKWFWKIYKDFTEMGVAGWWGDLGEPEVHPSDMIHEIGTANQVHNIYGHDWARMIFEGFREDFPQKRPFILMRAGYSGSQRFGMIPWSGDVNRSWGGLQAQPEIILQMGLQGIAYMHSDLGGFAGGEVFDPELYIRWLQYGVFQPVFRPHAQEHIAPEPVFHDEKTRNLAKKAIELRYKLLPYNYTLAFENHVNGSPFSRPLFFEEPENENLYTYQSAFLWGENFLVAPVLEKDLKTQPVYFPKGETWFDFYTDDQYEGGKTVSILLKEDHIPLFVRGGSFIPMIDVIQTTDDYSLQRFQLHYYHDPEIKKSHAYIFNDDGKTPNAYENGNYERMDFYSEWRSNTLELKFLDEIHGDFKPGAKQIELIIHRVDKPKNLAEGTYRYNPYKRRLSIPVHLNKAYKTIKINF